MDIFSDLASKLHGFEDLNAQVDEHLGFEPWDCTEPDEQMVRAAQEDGVDLFKGPQALLAGERPRPFQSGIMTSVKKIAIDQGGSQIGKSFPVLKLIEIAASHKIPHSLRHPMGKDTGVRRRITPENVKRYGRIDIATGKVIDFDPNNMPDLKSWDCGNIMGHGIFPQQLLAPQGCQMWIGTLPRSIPVYWWPKICGGEGERVFSEDLLDRRKANKGSDKGLHIVHLINNIDLHVKSYDMEHVGFESNTAFILVLDEEPKNSKIFRSAYEHCEYLRMCFTPLNGITWSRETIFGGGFDLDYFHATQYDSPYQDRAEVEAKRKGYADWDRKIVIWGEYAEQTGKPFYDREKVNLWISKHVDTQRFAQPEPMSAWHGIRSQPEITNVPGLMDVKIKPKWHTEDNLRNRWRIYEPPKPGVGYLISSDQAEGAETVEAVGDWSTAIVARQDEDNPEKPVICATLRSSLEVFPFARSVLYCARWYNNALLAPENGRGSANASFSAETREWPFYYMFQTIQDSTNKPRKKRGFDTNAGTRHEMFELVRDWIDSHPADEDPEIPDIWILKEAAGAVIGKTRGGEARCDHTSDGTLDSLTAFAILLRVVSKDYAQISCNVEDEPKRDGFISRVIGAQMPHKSKFLKLGKNNARP